jgi:uncharacterized protein (DUF302 family)
MNYSRLTLQACFMGLMVFLAGSVFAGDVHKRAGAYYIEVPATVGFDQVIHRLDNEVAAKNWDVIKVQDVDQGLKENYHMDIENKIVYVCKSQYLAQAIKEDPNITLIVPCRFTVYRVNASGKASGGGAGKAGKIVVGFADPAEEARHLGIKHAKAARIASKELQEVLQAVADDLLKMK